MPKEIILVPRKMQFTAKKRMAKKISISAEKIQNSAENIQKISNRVDWIFS